MRERGRGVQVRRRLLQTLPPHLQMKIDIIYDDMISHETISNDIDIDSCYLIDLDRCPFALIWY